MNVNRCFYYTKLNVIELFVVFSVIHSSSLQMPPCFLQLWKTFHFGVSFFLLLYFAKVPNAALYMWKGCPPEREERSTARMRMNDR